jgi:Baseplate J-like protein
MPINPPNLDDRTHRDIMEELQRLVPKYCPEWTDHNPSDPGITLLELFSWLTEMTIYKLNMVSDKTYVALLDLVGMSLLLPQPSETYLTFEPSKVLSSSKIVPVGTQIATSQSEATESVVFETIEDLHLSPVKLERIFSSAGDAISDNSKYINNPSEEGFPVFGGVSQIERAIFIGDDKFSALSESASLFLRFKAASEDGKALLTMFDMEYFNGKRFKELKTRLVYTETLGENESLIEIVGPIGDLEKTEIDGLETYWFKGGLTAIPSSPQVTELDTISVEARIVEDGPIPEAGFSNIAGSIFLPLEFSKSYYPFSEEPKYDYTFYLSSPDILSKEESEIILEIDLADPGVVEQPSPSSDLVLIWEYFNGKKWTELGSTSPSGVSRPAGKFSFTDSTLAFTHSGEIKFDRPEDLSPSQVNGQDGHWIRCRLSMGNYGEAGHYEQVGKNWVWKDDNPLHPPCVKSTTLRYTQKAVFVSHLKSYADFTYRDFSEDVSKEYKTFQLFEEEKDRSPSLYLGLESASARETYSVCFIVREDQRLPVDELTTKYIGDSMLKKSRVEQKVWWEYYNGKDWSDLLPYDSTNSFKNSGIVRFDFKKTFKQIEKFGQKLFWIRCRFQDGGYAVPPELKAVLTNSVMARNHSTISNEVLGSSDGTPDQKFKFSNPPVLEGQRVYVREISPPSKDDMEIINKEEGEDALDIEKDSDGNPTKIWVRWHEVENFYTSSGDSRHYVIDHITGEIKFGDGRNGMRPPSGSNNITARQYRTGGGGVGNVGARGLTILRRTNPDVQSVVNFFPATGGSDLETVSDAKLRAPQIFRNRFRAVTSEDYEWLAQRASSNIARSHCISNCPNEGEVTVVIVPHESQSQDTEDTKILPSTQLLNMVRDYLEPRRLLTTKLNIIRPSYLEVSFEISYQIKATGADPERVKRDLERNIRTYLHPLRGGIDHKGWQFGKTLMKTDLYRIIEDTDGIEYVDSLGIYDEQRKLPVDKIDSRADQLFFVADVNSRQVRRDY